MLRRCKPLGCGNECKMTRSEFHHNLLMSTATRSNRRDGREQHPNGAEAWWEQPRKPHTPGKGKMQHTALEHLPRTRSAFQTQTQTEQHWLSTLHLPFPLLLILGKRRGSRPRKALSPSGGEQAAGRSEFLFPWIGWYWERHLLCQKSQRYFEGNRVFVTHWGQWKWLHFKFTDLWHDVASVHSSRCLIEKQFSTRRSDIKIICNGLRYGDTAIRPIPSNILL